MHRELVPGLNIPEAPSWLHEFPAEERPKLANLVRSLSRPNNIRSVLAITFDYGAIALAILMHVTIGGIWCYAISVIVIGARQHALLVLMHDAAHFRLLTSRKWNEQIANIFCGWPFFISTEKYRENHLAHHNFLNTERDPDWMRKQGKAEWSFPKKLKHVLGLLIGQLAGVGLLDLVRALRHLGSAPRIEDGARKSLNVGAGFRVVYYLVFVTALTLLGLWREFVLYWVVPFLTFLPFVLRVRSIAEHFGLPATSEFTKSRHVDARWLERFLISPHNISHHTAHHFFPSVPFCRLSQLHRSLMTIPSYRDHAHINAGYFWGGKKSVLFDLTHSPDALGSEGDATRSHLQRA